ncbi:SsgA family sporulation/cell division regulator [Streptomyces genisteinicus]|uniref:SsgA family sporulation/cell division regulator n=1 Tax=Streptomyces genisteinicus TaxID=2768068 RepID=A0A7H0I0H9_9ACTN|nr:SsgA family sporulation/cell division regulator [Streptomyces genisteinicus]QNP66295.1 SsgA family sporulation/cell division regulator [Streptomyces genisteinicus]
MSSSIEQSVEQSVTARLIGDAAPSAGVPVIMRYRPADPFAVRMVFPPEACLGDTSVTWAFARSLLDSGLRTPAGDGDVHIWPCGRVQTMVELRSPDGVALLQFATSSLRGFLADAYDAVPAGEESAASDIDHDLAVLLGGAAD